jgi:phosphoribosylanthranilate isomerase
MFRVKICGITSVDDALAATAAGADAIGLNFYSGSPRYCPPEQAKAIAAAVPDVCKVGVFVNASAGEICQIAESVRLDLVQLHGDETPELMRAIRPLGIVRAFRVSDDLSSISEYLRQCHALMCVPRMLLVDAAKAGQYGGTGATLDWTWIGKNRAHFGGLPLVLAGGLNPKNVGAAIEAVRPWGVDTASGVETSPGQKSPALVREFVAAAREALARAAVRK